MKSVSAALFRVFSALVLVTAGPALAGSRQAPAKRPAQAGTGLPGVDRGFTLVTPLPAEPDDAPRPGQFGQFRAGNFDVKVSGKLTFDIGVGKLPPPRR